MRFNSLTMSFKNEKHSIILKGINPRCYEVVNGVEICQLTLVERKACCSYKLYSKRKMGGGHGEY